MPRRVFGHVWTDSIPGRLRGMSIRVRHSCSVCNWPRRSVKISDQSIESNQIDAVSNQTANQLINDSVSFSRLRRSVFWLIDLIPYAVNVITFANESKVNFGNVQDTVRFWWWSGSRWLHKGYACLSSSPGLCVTVRLGLWPSHTANTGYALPGVWWIVHCN